MALLEWCAVSCVCAVALLAFAAMQPHGVALRAAWSVLLLLGEALPLLLLVTAWRHVRYVIPFLGPPIRIGMQPVWWALAAVILSYAAAVLDTVRARSPWWAAVLPPVHAVTTLLRIWKG